ncbi:hypothetical protein D3C71_998960 [compost metagenome]
MQREALAGAVLSHFRRHFQTREFGFPFTPRALFALVTHRVQANVGAGQQRAQAGDAAEGQARPHHPKHGALTQQAGGVIVHADRHHHAVAFGIQADALHQPNRDFLVPDLRLVGLKAFSRLEVDGSRGPRVEPGLHHQQQSADHGYHGH